MRPLLFALLLSACSPGGGDKDAQTVDVAAMDDEAASRARTAAADLGATLKETLVGTLTAEGPAAAVELCSANASGLTVEIGRKHRVKIGRSSLRLRNPENAGPRWVQAWLQQQGERPAEGVQGLEEIVEAEGARMARLIKPMKVEAPCLVCHGPEPVEPVRPLLAAKYPSDQAVGYAVGDLRGALWVEVDIQ
jgi:hypothetical protein